MKSPLQPPSSCHPRLITSAAHLAQVRERLMATGDMQASPGDAYLYDEAVMEAVADAYGEVIHL